MPHSFESKDPRFQSLLPENATVQKLCTGAAWSEGPVYIAEEDCLLWSDIPNNRMLRWADKDGMSVYRSPSNFTNGHFRDKDGNLISCEHGGRRISRTDGNGNVSTVVDNYHGKKLNSPNDVIVKSDGSIWFTDPPYGILSNDEGYKAESELGNNYVFRFDLQSDELTIATDLIEEPNGLAFSPDESILYISDTSAALKEEGQGNHHIMQFDVLSDNKTLANGRLLAEVNPGLADGFRIDKNGYIYTSSADSIQVISPQGELLGKIFVPEKIANCTFGGPNKDRLFIVASTSLYAIDLNTQGVQTP